MHIRRRPPTWIPWSIGAIAIAALLLAGVSIFLNATSCAAIDRLLVAKTSGKAASGLLRWGTIESSDRETYAANLRAIGCPEVTISAILDARSSRPAPDETVAVAQAGSAAAGAFRSRAISSPTNGVNFATPSIIPRDASVEAVTPSAQVSSEDEYSPADPGTIDAAPRRSEVAKSAPSVGGGFSSFAGSARPSGIAQNNANPGSAADSTSGQQDIVAPDNNVLIPAAFQPADSNAPLSDQAKATQDALQQEFVNAIQNGKDASTPISPKAWQTAQRESDERFRELFGYQAFLQRQIAANLSNGSTSN